MLIKKSKNLTILQKCEVLIEYSRKNGNIRKPIKTMTVDKQGRPVGRYQQELRNAYNKGNLNLPPEKIKELKQLKVLFRPQKEYEEMSQKYGIPANIIKRIEIDYNSIENLVERHKKIGILSNYWMNYYGIKNYNAILLSSRDMTVSEKSAYVRFVIDNYTELRSKLFGTFINRDYIDEVLSMLPENERHIVEMIYGMNGKSKNSKISLSKKMQISIQDINKILKKAGKILHSKEAVVFRIEDIEAEIDKLRKNAETAKLQGNKQLYNQICKKIEHFQELMQECIQAYERFMQFEDIFNGDEIIMASGKSHLDFTFSQHNLTYKESTLQDRHNIRVAKEQEVLDLQARIDEQRKKELIITERLNVDSRDKTKEK